MYDENGLLTKVVLFKNTPYTDFTNMVDFGSNEARDEFMMSVYETIRPETDFNFIRDRLVMTVPTEISDWQALQEVNYVSFVSQFDGITYYAEVMQSEYINSGYTLLSLIIDGLMTFCQGGIAQYAKNVQIDRQHLTNDTFAKNIDMLRTNDDVLNIGRLDYVRQYTAKFDEFYVMIVSSNDLSADFGTLDDPQQKLSTGVRYDKITSPQGLYVLEYEQLGEFMGVMKDYPWIGQNFTKVQMIPKVLVDESDLAPVDMKTGGFVGLYRFYNDHLSKAPDVSILDKDWSEITYIGTGRTTDDEPYMVREPYVQIKLTNYQGSEITVDPAYLQRDEGLAIKSKAIVGYSNQMYFYADRLQTRGEQDGDVPKGQWIDNSVSFTTFDDIPTMIDSYKLSYAQSAHQRNLARSNTLPGQFVNFVNPNASLADRFSGAAGVYSAIATPGAVAGRLKDSLEFYRNQKAELDDKKISAPSVSDMTNTNSFAIRNDFFGLTIKFSAYDQESINFIRRYHKNFGFMWNRLGDLEDTHSMTHLNYVKFSGNWNINDRHVPQAIMEQIRVQFENGVKIWHNPDRVANPFAQDVIDVNVRRI